MDPEKEVPVSRAEAILLLKVALPELVRGKNHSLCFVAGEEGVFCHGYKRFDDEQLRLSHWFVDAAKPGMTRQEFERRIDAWQLERQARTGSVISCDFQSEGQFLCHGWNGFSNEELARYCKELVGVDVAVTD